MIYKWEDEGFRFCANEVCVTPFHAVASDPRSVSSRAAREILRLHQKLADLRAVAEVAEAVLRTVDAHIDERIEAAEDLRVEAGLSPWHERYACEDEEDEGDHATLQDALPQEESSPPPPDVSSLRSNGE